MANKPSRKSCPAWERLFIQGVYHGQLKVLSEQNTPFSVRIHRAFQGIRDVKGETSGVRGEGNVARRAGEVGNVRWGDLCAFDQAEARKGIEGKGENLDQAGCSKRLSSKAAGESKPEA